MKRFHVHVAVKDIEESVKFYSDLFDSIPAVQKNDYAKWMLDNPRVNFAISARDREAGLDHLGIQAEDEGELTEVSERLKSANMMVLDEGAATCCYARSEKTWVVDPQGIAWETFFTSGDSTVYGADNEIATGVPMHKQTTCCAPSVEAVQVELKRN